MSTPNGYILVKSSDFPPQTPSARVSAPAKETKEEVIENKNIERKSIEISGISLLSIAGKMRLGKGNLLQVSLPPQLDATQSFRKKFRYIAQGASGTNLSLVTVGSSLISFGCMAISTSQVSSIISSFKIHGITIYPAAGAINTSLEWTDAASVGTHMKDERKMTPVPTGITVSLPCHYKPPSGSEASFWQDGQGTLSALYAIIATAGSIIDVDATVTMQNTADNVQQTGFTSLTTGLVYYPALDGRSTNRLAPVGRTNAT
jgi:hypothetical protein